jgi:hypothetical protein
MNPTNDIQDDRAIEISFRLTLLQRLLNPLIVFIMALIGIFIIINGLLLVVFHVLEWRLWILGIAIAVIGYALFQRQIRWLFSNFKATQNVYTVRINKTVLEVGIEEPLLGISLRDLTIYKGLIKVTILSNFSGQVILIPNNEISFLELKQRIQKSGDLIQKSILSECGDSTLLSFSLTRKQRFFGESKMIYYITCYWSLVSFVPICFFGLVIAGGLAIFWFIALIITCLIIIILWVHGPFFSMISILKDNPYINTIEIGNEYVAFGYDKIQARLERKTFSVSKGNSDTCILRSVVGNSFLVPYSAITFEKLNELITAEIL